MRLRRPSPATIIASLALFFALAGTAVAAHHYLITSTKQIKPSVLKALKGRTGRTGPAGAAGPGGAAGASGAKGERGERGEQGPSHAYSASATGSEEVSVTVPAGKYVVSGTGTFGNLEHTEPGVGVCELEYPGATRDFTEATVPNTGRKNGSEHEGIATIPNQVTATLAAASTITEKCVQGFQSAVTVSVQYVTIAAIQVGALN